MNGKTHFTIGAVIGGIASIYYSPAQQIESVFTFIGIAGFSALTADLDGPSILTNKITKLSRSLHQLALLGGIIGLFLLGFLFLIQKAVSPIWIAASVSALLLGLIVKRGAFRNAIVSMIGLILLLLGYKYSWYWLMGFGLFTIIAPWLKHRGFTHTLWVVPLWGLIGYGVEQQLQIEGLGITAALGYLSHIVADMLTPAGVRCLYPLSKRKFKLKL